MKRHITCSFLEDSADAFPTPPATSLPDHLASQANGYPTPEIAAPPFELAPRTSASVTKITPPPLPATKFEILDLDLIHQYCTRTYMTISSRLATHVIWRDIVFQESLRHEWLLHGLMATAALHKAAALPKSSQAFEEYANVALTHQNTALAGYIPAVSNPNQDNGIALFSLSLILTVWGFASRSLPEGLRQARTLGAGTPDIRLPLESPTLHFVEIIMVLRGISPVHEGTNTWLRGDIEEMLRYPQAGDLPPHPPDMEETFDVLSEAVKLYQPEAGAGGPSFLKSRELCSEQVQRLRDISRCRQVVEWDGHIFSFLILAPPAFINDIKSAEPMALVIFAHWAAIFRCMDHHWWATGWAPSLVYDVSNLVDLSLWSRALDWPRRQCGLAFHETSPFDARRGP